MFLFVWLAVGTLVSFGTVYFQSDEFTVHQFGDFILLLISMVFMTVVWPLIAIIWTLYGIYWLIYER